MKYDCDKTAKKIVEKHTEKELERSLEYMDEYGDRHEIANEAGWLVECLKNGWWVNGKKYRTESAILEASKRWGVKLYETFIKDFWTLVDNNWILSMSSAGIEFAPDTEIVCDYLQFAPNGSVFVNWFDTEWQTKLPEIYQTMHWNEAIKRYRKVVSAMS